MERKRKRGEVVEGGLVGPSDPVESPPDPSVEPPDPHGPSPTADPHFR